MMESGCLMRLPVRRKLFVCSAAYLAGIYLTKAVLISDCMIYPLCALFLSVGVYRLRHRRRALIFLAAALFLLGNLRAGNQLQVMDTATAPGVLITGTVSRKESGFRVYLSDVVIDGKAKLNREALVTLMLDEEEKSDGNPPQISIGQLVTGTGRLFEQEGIRNPGGVDRRINALCKGYDLSGYIVPGWEVSGEEELSLIENFRQMKLRLSRQLEMLFGQYAPLYQAIMLGDQDDMDSGLVQAMRLTGIVHILTISGMHMSLLAYTLRSVTSKLSLRRSVRFVLHAFLLGSFACLTGVALGTIRAYIMAMIRETASLSGRKYDSLTSLGAAALIMTLICPVWALSVSFQFSFFVVLGILLLSRQLAAPIRNSRKCPALLKRAVQFVALTFSAQLAAVPMQLMFYGYIPLLSMPMNMISSMFVPAIMLCGWTALVLSAGFPQAATLLAQHAGRFTALLEQICIRFADHPWGILRLPAPYGISLTFAFFLLFAISQQVYIGKGRRAVAAAIGTILVLLYIPRFDPTLRYVQLDVGQGDGALIRRGRKAVLIDVGPESEYAALRYLRHEGLNVELVILSHADEDHAGALGVLLDSEVRITQIALPVGALDDVGSQAVIDALGKAEEAGVAIAYYEKGDKICTDEFTFSVLSPETWMSGGNERSLVLYAELNGIRLLTLGDLPETCEMEDVPPCDILKVAHHGSRYATSKELMEKASPRIAVISVGRNSYGHPTDRVLNDLSDVGAEVYRTDQTGCITIRMKRNAYDVKTHVQ